MSDAAQPGGPKFTPKALGARLRMLRQPQRTPAPPAAWREGLDDALQTLDLTPRMASGMKPAADHGAVRYACLLEADPSPSDVAEAWGDVLGKSVSLTAAEGLLFELHASLRPYEFAAALPKNYSYSKTLHVIRTRTGIALHDYAREVNWRRPILFIATLKLARQYHRAAVASQELTRAEFRREFTGRLGVATVLISRFEAISLDDATEAVEALRASLDQGNDTNVATAYLLEAMSVLFDMTGDVAILEDARNFLGTPEQFTSSNTGWQLASVEVALRLHDAIDLESRRIDLMRYCTETLDFCKDLLSEAENRLRWTVLDTLVRAIEPGAPSGIRGIRIPFGARHGGHTPQEHRLGAELLKAVRPLAQTGEPLARGIYADLLEHLPVDDSKRMTKLRMSLLMRGSGPKWSALGDERSMLLVCRDRLQLATLEVDSQQRHETLEELISLSRRATCGTAALVLIAKHVEEAGSAPIPDRAAWTREQRTTAALIRKGDFRGILATSAADALASPDLSVSTLGGRSGVVTVSDYYDVVGGTFVFKSTTVLSWLRELRRSDALRSALRDAGLHHRFGVVDHLSPSESELANTASEQIVSTVRRFESGVVLDEYVAGLPADQRARAVSLGAEYLGYINSLESRNGGPITGARKDVKAKEVGRWLKRIAVEDPNRSFDVFWSIYDGLPLYRRRDAHPLNWLIVTEDRLLAVDLEATGWRPLTYEVAQLTEDACLLEPTDWAARLEVLDAYLGACEHDLSQRVIAAFEASIFARSLRKLTPPTGYGATLQNGLDTLAFLSKNASDLGVRSLAQEVTLAWQRARGLPPEVEVNLNLTDGRRRRLSRAMAFHLRHDDEMDRDEAGWVDVSLLASRIGDRATPAEIALVASDFREPRFEVEGSKVRARYGHTREAKLDHALAQPEVVLFHATSLSVAETVLTREGLRPMQRQFVHLSSAPALAARSGWRHGPGLLLTVESEHVADVRHAAESTYVAPRITANLLRVVPVWFVHGSIR